MGRGGGGTKTISKTVETMDSTSERENGRASHVHQLAKKRQRPRCKDSHSQHRPAPSTHMLKQPQHNRRLALALFARQLVSMHVVLAPLDRLEHDVGCAVERERRARTHKRRVGCGGHVADCRSRGATEGGGQFVAIPQNKAGWEDSRRIGLLNAYATSCTSLSANVPSCG